MQPIVRRAPAKINLHLRVFPVGGDGFHPLRSWFRTVGLWDEVTISLGPGADPEALDLDSLDRVELMMELQEGALVRASASDPAVPTDEGSLIVRAAHEVLPRGRLPIDLHLDKRIPIGAGLGGGSSDAAAVLEGAMRFAGLELPYAELAMKAVRLGADVPFFLRHQLEGITDATCTGRGEIVQPFTPGRRHAVLLILPDLHVSTAQVYRRFDELPAPAEEGEPDFAAWSRLPALALLPLLRNDLEAAAFSLHPSLAELRQRAWGLLGRPVRMTGSGSGLFSLYDTHDEASAALQRLDPLAVRRLVA